MGCTGSKQANYVVPPSTNNNKSGTTNTSIQSSTGTSSNSTEASGPREIKKPFALTYELREKLGQGQYAIVHKGIRKSDGMIVAVKCIKKDKLTKEDLEALSVEVKSMEMLRDNPFFVKYYDFFSEKDYFFIVLELISGGELFDRICEKAKYTEREARKVMWMLTSALAYAHGKNIVHRDLKPENILLKSRDDDTSIKLADMGFAKILTGPNQLMSTPCGTPGYVAPEVIGTNPLYGPKCDVWSLGVIFYILLCGYPPFSDDDQNALFKQIRSGRYAMDPAEWSIISDSAKDLVRRILIVDPEKRLSAQEILHHPWMKMDATAIPDVDLSSSVAQLRRYQARRRLKKAINAVRVTVRTRMLFAARAAKAAKERGADENEVEKAFFEAARKAPSTRNAPTDATANSLMASLAASSQTNYQIPPLPAANNVARPGQPQQFKISAIVTPPTQAVEVRGPTMIK